MKFKSDSQRKAVFANLFNQGDKTRSKVSSSNVKNFEVKIPRNKKGQFFTADPKIKMTRLTASEYKLIMGNRKNQKVDLKDIKTKEGRAFCNMCKREGLSLEKGKCGECKKIKHKYDMRVKEREGKKLSIENRALKVLDIMTDQTNDDEVRLNKVQVRMIRKALNTTDRALARRIKDRYEEIDIIQHDEIAQAMGAPIGDFVWTFEREIITLEVQRTKNNKILNNLRINNSLTNNEIHDTARLLARYGRDDS